MNKLWITVITTLLVMQIVNAGGDFNPSYPRTAAFSWGGGSAEWYSKFDLVIFWQDDATAREIKQIDPSTLVFWTEDWNVGSKMRHDLPDEYAVHNADGSRREVYCTGCDEYMADFTDCVGQSHCGYHDGKKFTEALVDLLASTDFTLYDGISTDGFWRQPGWQAYQGMDLDRNGVDDVAEHGEGWIRSEWNKGSDSFIDRLNSATGNKPLLINSGSFHSFWWDKHNGPILEGAWAMYQWSTWKQQYDQWMNQARSPHLLVVDGKATFDSLYRPDEWKNYYRLMRFLLTSTMLGDGYYNFNSEQGNAHGYVKYYDEFDLDIGHPKGAATRLSSGVYVRFFDSGMVIVNPTNQDKTISHQDISALSGYNGPYYRFQGGQNPQTNNGAQFTSITLKGDNGLNEDGSTVTVGDGIILVDSKQTVIADIVVDERDFATSPGSDEASRTGTWSDTGEGVWGDSAKAWAAGPPWINYNYKYTEAHNSNTYADFRPTIGVAGEYAVYEWHSNLKNVDKQAATNVEYAVTHANGVSTAQANHAVHAGKWNYLGTYRFSAGTSGFVRLKTVGANGVVIADAVKFVAVGNALSCSAQNGNDCSSNKECSGNWLPASDNAYCCSGSCTATPPPSDNPGDANNDGKVDIQDLIIVAQNFGKSNYTGPADLDNNSKVDITDLIIVARNFGKVYT